MSSVISLGEKIKKARLEAGLTQEELSELLMVSRAAVAKWETNRGLPDIDNLKFIASALSVSVDYLLDENNSVDFSITKKPINLNKYGFDGRLSGFKKSKIKEQIVLDEYPDSEINMLTVVKTYNSSSEKMVDNFVGWFSTLLGGLPLFDIYDFSKAVSTLGADQYYLVDKKDKQYFVLITDEYIISRIMGVAFNSKKFRIGDKEFMKVGKLRNK
ncbi:MULTISPECIES: helix-turn-helix transcriptional regulator [Gardnerella]|uniref:DNA-binding helix-turn-helix protein n=1 Tax=Gardnerella pickettii JCP8017A TaxID=1261062 RepID=T2PKF6_9BIFI|nr:MULTISPECIES: helix-turn-helix transcriptional regulator [Gardnerella]EPI46237.1 DNA-binding helix-turn-helix protein [Gardnerella vaginalis JCP8151A]EPI52356.1 DNA-binding helix-turn-helix protein [Gardnerella pickettii JCP8017A]EPI61787.1 DNA-binding helix-turn-helix protein [Gardnerella pickettii JCP8017B]NSX26170.1 helix-turn-helix transcriptional regulator [Gardnerella vaginalis]UQA79831.1 helix-turn-helix transcriptional regulator [Gardnerella vaginalis]